MRTLDEVVLEAPIFADLDARYAEQLAGCSRTVGFEAGETLFREGEPADVFYVVRRGRVALELFVPAPGISTRERLRRSAASPSTASASGESATRIPRSATSSCGGSRRFSSIV